MRAVAVYWRGMSEADRQRDGHRDAAARGDPAPARAQVTHVTKCVERFRHGGFLR